MPTTAMPVGRSPSATPTPTGTAETRIAVSGDTTEIGPGAQRRVEPPHAERLADAAQAPHRTAGGDTWPPTMTAITVSSTIATG